MALRTFRETPTQLVPGDLVQLDGVWEQVRHAALFLGAAVVGVELESRPCVWKRLQAAQLVLAAR